MRPRPSLLPCLLLLGCSLVRVDPAVEAEYQSLLEETAAETDQLRPVVEADLKALSAYPWMADRTCTKDASELLHPLFGFDDSTYRSQGLLPPPTHTEAEAEALRKAATRWRSPPEGQHWMTQGAHPDVQAMTLPWVASLRDFDCWNITAHSPWDEVDPLELDFSLPKPMAISLFHASMVRLMQLHSPLDDAPESDQARILQALQDVRHLATLCIQSQDHVMAQYGVSILQREREAVELLRAQGRMPEGWSVVPKADSDRLMRLLAVAPAFSSLFTPPQHRDLATSEAFAVGRCAGIREGLRTALPFQGLLADEQLEWLQEVLDQSAALGCHHDDIRALHSRPEKRYATYEPFDNPLLPPAMRRSSALSLALVGLPAYTGWEGSLSAEDAP